MAAGPMISIHHDDLRVRSTRSSSVSTKAIAAAPAPRRGSWVLIGFVSIRAPFGIALPANIRSLFGNVRPSKP